ncbi:putative GABA permease [Xylariaceae sp. FL1272]|nr:putative GABA permease [Xylariaceae sp. FL1272]
MDEEHQISKGDNGAALTADQLLLRAQGHEEEMPRQFSLTAALGLAFSITNSWVAISATFQQPMTAGGGPGVLYSLLVAAFSCAIITAGLAELASAFPTSGGQYHFVFMMAPKKHRAVIAFYTGWLSVVAWILCTAASAIYAAQIFAALATSFHPDYTPTAWQIWLIYVGIMVLCTLVLTLLPTMLARIEKASFFASVIGFVVFLIVILATASPKNPAHIVFADLNNQSGWSDGLGFMLSVGTAMYTFIGTDAVIHVSEEIPNAQKNVPRTMGLVILIGAGTAVPWTIAFLFSGGDYETLRTALLPIHTMFLSATANKAAANFFTIWYLIVYLGATLSCHAATGRQTWAFARDGGLPGSGWVGTIHPKFQMPMNATILCAVVISVYGLIYVGSTTAFNSFVNASILAMNVSYVIPQAIALYQGRERVLPVGELNLGKFGPWVNGFSVAWVSVYVVLFCFPLTYPTSVQSMNYVSVVTVAVVVIITGVWYGGKRKTFNGPKLLFEDSDLDTVAVINGITLQNKNMRRHNSKSNSTAVAE